MLPKLKGNMSHPNLKKKKNSIGDFYSSGTDMKKIWLSETKKLLPRYRASKFKTGSC